VLRKGGGAAEKCFWGGGGTFGSFIAQTKGKAALWLGLGNCHRSGLEPGGGVKKEEDQSFSPHMILTIDRSSQTLGKCNKRGRPLGREITQRIEFKEIHIGGDTYSFYGERGGERRRANLNRKKGKFFPD